MVEHNRKRRGGFHLNNGSIACIRVGFSVVRVAKRQIRCELKRLGMEKSVRSQKGSNWLKMFGVS